MLVVFLGPRSKEAGFFSCHPVVGLSWNYDHKDFKEIERQLDFLQILVLLLIPFF